MSLRDGVKSSYIFPIFMIFTQIKKTPYYLSVILTQEKEGCRYFSRVINNGAYTVTNFAPFFALDIDSR